MTMGKTFRTDLHEFQVTGDGTPPPGVWELAGCVPGMNGRVVLVWARYLPDNPVRLAVKAERSRVLSVFHQEMQALRSQALWPSKMEDDLRQHLTTCLDNAEKMVRDRVKAPAPVCDPALEGQP